MTENITLDKRVNETEFQHHKRLIEGKLVDKTLSDYDYSELAKYVYGQDYSADVARRMMYGSAKTIKLLSDENIDSITDDKVLTELDTKIIELQKERQKFYDQRREYNKLICAEGRNEHLLSIIKEAANNLNRTVGLMYDGINEVSKSNNDIVVVLSDWHYGLKADNIFNTYNTDICKERVAEVVNSVISKIKLHQCENAHIIVLGDLIHGAVHTSVRVASEELVCDQLMQVSEILAQSICEISKHVLNTDVHITYGNHARTVQNKNDSIHRDNMERLIGWWLKERLAGLPVTVSDESPNELLLFSVRGHWFLGTHGDLDSAKTSPRLFGTLLKKQYGVDIEYILLGDKHHRESFDELGITAMICGSLCGTDEYSNGKRLFSTPSQIALIVNEIDGVDAEYIIKCKK